jgi:circadian clock protein KaiC
LFTSLTRGGTTIERSEVGISSLIDTWLLVRDIELGGERNRGLYVIKSRGMPHSNQIREFLLTDHGVELRDVYAGPGGVLTGSMRLAQEARDKASALTRQQEIERRQRELDRKRGTLEAQMAELRSQYEAEEQDLRMVISQEQHAADRLRRDEDEMAQRRKADAPENSSRRDKRK